MGRGRPEPASRKSDGKYSTDSKGCFIATAVYGDFNAPEVIALRRWRDQVLLCTPSGRAMIVLYYRLSPPIARYLERSPRLAGYTRKLLNTFVRRRG